MVGWVVTAFSRGSSWPRDWTWDSCIAESFFTIWATWEAHELIYGLHYFGIYSLYTNIVEKEMANHSSILDWRIPWTKEPGGLQSMGSQRVGHDWATNIHTDTLRRGEFFIINGCWVLWNAFFAFDHMVYSDDHMIFMLLLLMYHIDRFPDIEPPLHPRITLTWSQCMILLIYYWIQFAIIEDFYIDVHQWHWPIIFFFAISLYSFSIKVMLASFNEFRSVPHSATFWTCFRRIVINSSLNVW